MSYEKIGQALRALREEGGHSQSHVAGKIGLKNASTVSYIESGSSGTSLDRLDAYARLYGHRVVVHVVREGEAVLPVNVTRDVLAVVEALDRMEPEDRLAIVALATMVPHLPPPIRRTMRGQVDLWRQEATPDLRVVKRQKKK